MYMNYPVREALTQLNIRKTDKHRIYLSDAVFGEEDQTLTIVSTSQDAEDFVITLDNDGLKVLGRLFGMNSGYIQKMPWKLFKTNIDFWANSGDLVLLESFDVFGINYLARAANAEKALLTREQLLAELFTAIDDTTKLRYISTENDVVTMDLQYSERSNPRNPYEYNNDNVEMSRSGVRVVADLTLKKGVKFYSLWNACDKLDEDLKEDENNWYPVVFGNNFNLPLRGRMASEIYESTHKGFDHFAEQGEWELREELWRNAYDQKFVIDSHARGSLASLAMSKEYMVSKKLVTQQLPVESTEYIGLNDYVEQIVSSPWLNAFRNVDVQSLQTFAGDLLRMPGLLKECVFCHNKLNEVK